MSHSAGRLDRRGPSTSTKGDGFKKPLAPHKHWHVDVSYINVSGTFYFLITVLDGYSRYLVHHELRESMKDLDIEIVCQAALEKHPGVSPRIITAALLQILEDPSFRDPKFLDNRESTAWAKQRFGE